MADKILICKEQVKRFFNQQKLKVSDDFYDNFNNELRNILQAIASRAVNNRRSTVLPKDI